ncbi:AraC family transcriptional regulator [uncultured Vagococcus sp.]|uniref:helix-turn-helix domain-containing protein n=1 Tax=uncultured Vagococcus sp. TaxID=189676 RepID=UPI0028D8C0B3|nr:AraC family transcriptional regulator [uncultured Vagococcus sp.]
MNTDNTTYLNGFFYHLEEKRFFLKQETSIKSYIQSFENNPELSATAFISDNPIKLTYRVPYFRLLYVLKGSIGISVDQKELDFFEGGVILANPNSHIVYRGMSTDTEVATIIFKPEFFSNLFLSDLVDLPLFYDFVMQGLDENYQKSNYFFFQQSLENFSNYLLLFLFKETILNNPNKAVKHPALFLLLSELDDNKDKTLVLEKSTLPSNLFIGEILKHINHHYDEVSLNELATLYNLHPNSLSSMIKKQTGKNFSEHLTEVRLNRASYYLKNSTVSVQEISEKMGYQDKSYFFRLFKKHFGLSPNQYRKKNQQFIEKT